MNPVFLTGAFQATIPTLDFLSIDPSGIIITLLNTLILFLLIKHFLFGRVNKILEERQADVKNTYDEADKAMNEANEMKENYQGLLSNAKTESADIIKNATKKAQVRSEEIIEQAKTDADGLMLRANDEIEREKKRAKSQIKDEISDIAVMVAEKVVEKELSAEEHERLINDFIENVGDL